MPKNGRSYRKKKRSARETVDQYLSRIYFNPANPASFGGLSKLLKYLSEKGTRKIEPERVKAWLSSKETYTLHKDRRRKGPTRSTIVSGINSLWQADLSDLPDLASANDGHRYLLCVIDIFTKFLYARPLKTKTGLEVTSGFRSIIESAGQQPLKLQTDRGKEFKNTAFQSYLSTLGIEFYHSHNYDVKASLVERVQRSFKSRLFRYMTYNNSRRYLEALDRLVDSYNKSYHRSIGMPPSEVTIDNQESVWHRLYGESSTPHPEKIFNVGDKVRISKERLVFDKSYLTKWTQELFTVKIVMQTNPVVYRLSDESGGLLEGTWYDWELQGVDNSAEGPFRIEEILAERKVNGRTQILVKWQGYDSSYNSYVDKASVIDNYKN